MVPVVYTVSGEGRLYITGSFYTKPHQIDLSLFFFKNSVYKMLPHDTHVYDYVIISPPATSKTIDQTQA